MLSTLLLLLAPQSAPQATVEHFSCGPFLLQPGPRAMTIVVDHVAPVPVRLRHWTVEGGEVRELEHVEPARHHVFHLDGLTPDTRYSYEIASAGLSTGTHTFRTLPEFPERYRVLAMGDVRSRPAAWGAVSTRMFEHEPDALITIGTGDYPSDGRKYEQWIEQFFSPARAFLGHMPLLPAIGNHEATRRHDDVTNIENSHYFSLFELPGNERWYRVDYHLMTLFVVDSNSHMLPGEPQYEWLRGELRSPRNRFTLVALHHAPLTSGPHGRLHPDGTPAEWPIDEGRRFLVPLLEMYDADLVLTGHDHLYERSEKDGIVYIVTGGGGAPLYKVDSVENPYQQAAVSTHHYVALDIAPGGIDVTAIDVDGEVIDRARVPVTERHLERRMRSVTQALEGAVEFGPLDAATHMSPVLLHNPLDHPLTVGLTTARRGNTARPLRETLAPGERREVPWHVEDVGGDLRAQPWRAAVVLDLRIHLEGRDGAIDVDTELKRKVTVYRPVHATGRLDSVVVDGDLSEWRGLSPMLADGGTPIVKNATSHGGPEDLGAELRFAWSEGWLHLAADITDESVVDDTATKIDENDAVRLLFDVRSGPAKGVAIHTFAASGRAESTVEATQIRHVVRERDGGWILEASFPLEALGLDGAGGDSRALSCDVMFIDRDLEGEEARPSYHRFWTSSRSRSDTSTFGLLELED